MLGQVLLVQQCLRLPGPPSPRPACGPCFEVPGRMEMGDKHPTLKGTCGAYKLHCCPEKLCPCSVSSQTRPCSRVRTRGAQQTARPCNRRDVPVRGACWPLVLFPWGPGEGRLPSSPSDSQHPGLQRMVPSGHVSVLRVCTLKP